MIFKIILDVFEGFSWKSILRFVGDAGTGPLNLESWGTWSWNQLGVDGVDEGKLSQKW